MKWWRVQSVLFGAAGLVERSVGHRYTYALECAAHPNPRPGQWPLTAIIYTKTMPDNYPQIHRPQICCTTTYFLKSQYLSSTAVYLVTYFIFYCRNIYISCILFLNFNVILLKIFLKTPVTEFHYITY